MPKTKARKRGNGGRGSVQQQTAPVALARTDAASAVQAKAPAGRVSRKAQKQAASKHRQGLMTAGMVALGCWGLTASFVFFTTDANHYLYGAMASMMAILWTVMFGMRLHKGPQQ